ncbi:hypothetical protein [Streptomyces sp. W1SF4]|uniref:hypothetical protein n=1 Tax=Streptomyces sp. W1SF4 TaxID=2305220 RepID=UPI000F6FC742|nr:hypothetical protein [Streptomyces sp. W1SF4]AZM91450.1 hypothetical protein D1J60_25690 [Streptomyces sp. W1SF4]
MGIELTDELIKLRRAANEARARATAGPYSAEAWRPWAEAAAAVHEAITKHAADTGQNRYEVEKAVVTAAKAPAPPEAGAE